MMPAQDTPLGAGRFCLRADGSRKLTWLTKKEAKQAARSSPPQYRIAGPVHSYLCPDCGYYHVGHEFRTED
jgi:hypothetical protein